MFIDLFHDEHSLLKDLTAEKKENMKIWREKKVTNKGCLMNQNDSNDDNYHHLADIS